MVWMGSKADIAAITATDITPLQDNIVFAAVAELKFLLLQKTSTATVDNATVWAAVPSGRWHLTGGSGGGGGSSTPTQASMANIAAIVAQNAASINDGATYFAIAEGVWLLLNKTSTASCPAGSRTCWASVGTGNAGRWMLANGQTVVSPNHPSSTGFALPGITWIWEDQVTPPTPPEYEANNYFQPDTARSVITYTSTTNGWVELSARLRRGIGNPNDLGTADDYFVPQNSEAEMWQDTGWDGGLYYSYSGTWLKITFTDPTLTGNN